MSVRSSNLFRVTRREFLERGRSSSFQVSTTLMFVLVALAALLPGLLNSHKVTTRTVGAVGPQALAVVRLAAQHTSAGGKLRIQLESFATQAAARRAVAGGEVYAALISPGVLLSKDPPPSDLEAAVGQARLQSAVESQLAAAHVPPGARAQAFRSASLRSQLLDPSRRNLNTKRELALAGIFLLYMAVILYGLWISNGVVEEKASRIVELLLTTVRPTQLLIGKIAGIGALGLAQMVVLVGGGVAVASATGTVTLPSTTVSGALQLVLWFLIGFAMYATLYAASASLVSRQEDLTSATMPLTLVLLAGFLLSLQVISHPDGTLAVVTTFVPLTAPLVVPARAELSALPDWQFAIALVVSLLGTAGLGWLAGRVYAATLLQTASVPLGRLWRIVRGGGREATRLGRAQRAT